MTEADFLRFILAHPDDEVTRSAYADWLLERGDPAGAARGEFIQVQLQLARRAAYAGGPFEWADVDHSPGLKAREAALLAAHRRTWSAPLAGLVDAHAYSHGFVEHVTLDAGQFLQHGERLFALAPVRRVRLTGPFTPRVAASPLLGRLSGLDLSRSYLSDAGLRTLLRSPHLGGLRWLDLSRCYLSDGGLRALAESPWLAGLTDLNLGHNQVGLPGVQALFASPHWGKVRTLVLSGNPRLDAGAQRVLAQSLQGGPDPALLRSMLLLVSRQEREYTNAGVRDLARRAAGDPASAAAVLGEALGDGRRTVRSAAAQMLSHLGAAGAAGLPRLVQRLSEPEARTRDQVAPALARLLPELPAGMQQWLCLLANPLLSPRANLRAVLGRPDLPAGVREGFAAVCARRAVWWEKVAGKGAGPADDCRREAAWLLARLTELLQAALPPEPAAPPARQARKRV
jgi:uncharacterized protein (TIGR02996 family)